MEESNSPLYPLRLFGLVIEFGLSIILYFYFVFLFCMHYAQEMQMRSHILCLILTPYPLE